MGESSVKISIAKEKSLNVALEKQRLDPGVNRRSSTRTDKRIADAIIVFAT
jgi:hypothetical protein